MSGEQQDIGILGFAEGMLRQGEKVVMTVKDDITSIVPASIASIESITVPSLKDVVLANFIPIAGHMTRLADKYRDVAYDVKTTRGMADAKAARNELREQGRYPLQRLAARLKSEANDLKRVLDDEAARLIGIAQPVEDALHKQITEEEERKEREKAEAARVEAERVAALEGRYAGLLAWVERCRQPDMTSARIQSGIYMLTQIEIGDDWAEFKDRAAARKAATLEAMETMKVAAIAREAEEERLAEARREAERVAAEQTAAQQALANERASLDAMAATMAAERERNASIKRRIDGIRFAATGHERSTALDLREAIDAVKALEISEAMFGDFTEVAELAREKTIASLQVLLEAAVSEEDERDSNERSLLARDAETGAAAAPETIDPDTGEIMLEPAAQAELIERARVSVDDIIAAEVVSDVISAVVDGNAPPMMMNLGDISTRLGFTVTREFIVEKLGIDFRDKQKASVRWYVSDWPAIKAALVTHINNLS